jgi:cytochrome c oxidase cbb3-type subunit III
MRFIPFINKKITMAVALLAAVCTASAQDAAAAEKTVVSSNNQLATLLVVMTVVLAFVIWGLGQVLVMLSRQLMEKTKNMPKAVVALIVTTLLLAAQTASAQDAGAVAKEVPNYGGLSSTTFYFFVIVIVVEVLAVLFLAFSIRRMYNELMPQKEGAVKTSALGAWWDEMDKKLFTKAVPVEKEADVLLDHDYDGIKELDNALPPWWKYGFYITIAVAFVYIGYYHVFGSGKSPYQEYTYEMDKAKAAKAAFDATNKDKIDEANVPMADAAGIKVGEKLFEANCVACHMKGGGGSQNPPSVGPNLTDAYWLHKGSLNDIYATIKNGYPDKGMQSWSGKFNPKEMSQLASYIKSVQGSNPANAKAAQGELYTETVAPAAGDSAKTAKKTDSATVKMAVAADTAKAAPAK